MLNTKQKLQKYFPHKKKTIYVVLFLLHLQNFFIHEEECTHTILCKYKAVTINRCSKAKKRHLHFYFRQKINFQQYSLRTLYDLNYNDF